MATSDYPYNTPTILQSTVASLTSYKNQKEDFCRKTTCKCGAEVFFIRHNGGSIWVEELGWPWPKHECNFIGYDEKQYQCLAELKTYYERETVKPALGCVVKIVYRTFDLVHLIAMGNGELVAVSASRYVRPLTNLVVIRRTRGKIFLENGQNSILIKDCKLAAKVLEDYLNNSPKNLYVGLQPSGLRLPKLKKKKKRKR